MGGITKSQDINQTPTKKDKNRDHLGRFSPGNVLGYKSPQHDGKYEEYAKRIVDYVSNAPRPATWLGLCNYIAVETQSVYEWMNNNKHPLSSTLKRAKAKLLENVSNGMLTGSFNVAGSIFFLKNVHGFVDKTEVANTHEVLLEDFSNIKDAKIKKAKVIELKEPDSM